MPDPLTRPAPAVKTPAAGHPLPRGERVRRFDSDPSIEPARLQHPVPLSPGRGEKPPKLRPSPKGRGWSRNAGPGEGSLACNITERLDSKGQGQTSSLPGRTGTRAAASASPIGVFHPPLI